MFFLESRIGAYLETSEKKDGVSQEKFIPILYSLHTRILPE